MYFGYRQYYVAEAAPDVANMIRIMGEELHG